MTDIRWLRVAALAAAGVVLACARAYVPADAGADRRTIFAAGKNVWGMKLSPDGRTIAYGESDSSHADIFTVPWSSGTPTRLTRGPHRTWRPSWSPDGRQLAYTSARNGRPDIWVMSSRGTDHLRLTTDTTVEEDPGWSPDGRWIAYASNRGGAYNIWMVPARGGTESAAWAVSWAPDSANALHSYDIGTRLHVQRKGERVW